MDARAVVRRQRPFILVVGAHDSGNAQAVFFEDGRAPGDSRAAVMFGRTPFGHSSFVASEGEQQHPLRVDQALKPLDRTEPVDAAKPMGQRSGNVLAGLPHPGIRPSFEDDCDQGGDLRGLLSVEDRHTLDGAGERHAVGIIVGGLKGPTGTGHGVVLPVESILDALGVELVLGTTHEPAG